MLARCPLVRGDASDATAPRIAVDRLGESSASAYIGRPLVYSPSLRSVGKDCPAWQQTMGGQRTAQSTSGHDVLGCGPPQKKQPSGSPSCSYAARQDGQYSPASSVRSISCFLHVFAIAVTLFFSAIR